MARKKKKKDTNIIVNVNLDNVQNNKEEVETQVERKKVQLEIKTMIYETRYMQVVFGEEDYESNKSLFGDILSYFRNISHTMAELSLKSGRAISGKIELLEDDEYVDYIRSDEDNIIPNNPFKQSFLSANNKYNMNCYFIEMYINTSLLASGDDVEYINKLFDEEMVEKLRDEFGVYFTNGLFKQTTDERTIVDEDMQLMERFASRFNGYKVEEKFEDEIKPVDLITDFDCECGYMEYNVKSEFNPKTKNNGIINFPKCKKEKFYMPFRHSHQFKVALVLDHIINDKEVPDLMKLALYRKRVFDTSNPLNNLEQMEIANFIYNFKIPGIGIDREFLYKYNRESFNNLNIIEEFDKFESRLSNALKVHRLKYDMSRVKEDYFINFKLTQEYNNIVDIIDIIETASFTTGLKERLGVDLNINTILQIIRGIGGK